MEEDIEDIFNMKSEPEEDIATSSEPEKDDDGEWVNSNSTSENPHLSGTNLI